VANQREDSNVSKAVVEDVVMFETHMDEYLDEEVEWVKHAFDFICKGWDQETSTSSPTAATTRLLASHNPDLVKRNVLLHSLVYFCFQWQLSHERLVWLVKL